MKKENEFIRWSILPIIAAGGISTILGIVVILGWHTHNVTFIQVHPAFVPMQYNTALGFLLSGMGLLSITGGWRRPAMACGGIVAAVGLLTLIQYVFGTDLGIDQLLMKHYITVETSHSGRMAPNTALCFGLAGAVLLTTSTSAHFKKCPLILGFLGTIIVLLGAAAFFGYLSGAKTAYGWGHLTSMAVHTAAGFVVLGIGVMVLAWREGIMARERGPLRHDQEPEREQEPQIAPMADGPTKECRKVVAVSILIMTVASLIVGLLIIRELYNVALEKEQTKLTVLVKSWGALINSMGQFDAGQDQNPRDKAQTATLDKIIDAHENFGGIGKTGEFTLARREGNQIDFLLSHRHSGSGQPEPVDFNGERAEPMRRALKGMSGVFIGIDYRGERVLAAHEPLENLNWGLVAKIDLAEVREPFLRAAKLATAVAFTAIAIGAIFIFVTVNPMVRRLEEHTCDLAEAYTETKREITERKRAEEAIYHTKRFLDSIVENIPDMVFVKNAEDLRFVLINRAGEELIGHSREDLIGKTDYDFFPKEEADFFSARDKEVLASQTTVDIPEEPIDTRFKGRRVLHTKKISILNEKGQPEYLLGISEDITERKRAEEALRDSEERFRDLAEMLPETIFETDKEMNLTYANQKAFDLFGYSNEDFAQGLNGFELLAPEDRDRAKANLAMRLEGEDPRTVVYQALRKDGSTFPILFHASSIMKEGEPFGLRGIIVDITERKRAEQEVFRQSAILGAINEVFRETLTCETDEELGRTCLAVAEELTGSKFGFIGEVNKSGRLDTIALSDPGWDACRMPESDGLVMIKDMEIRGIWGRVIKTGTPLIANDPLSHPDRVGCPAGHPVLTSFLCVPLKRVGKTIGMIGLGNKEGGYDPADQAAVEHLSVAIVEALRRKRAENALRESERNLAKAQRIAKIGNYIWTIEIDEFIWSEEAYAIFGVLPNEFTPDFQGFVDRIHPSDRGYVTSILKQSLENKKPYSTEFRVVLRNGTECVLHSEGKVTLDANDNPIRMFGVVQDITDRKRAEERIRSYTEALERSNQELQDFAYVASHDLQEPLRKVMAFAGRLKSRLGDTIDDKGHDYLERMRGAAERMQKLIDDLLTYSRITTKVKPFEPVDMAVVAQDVLSDLQISIEQTGGRVEVADLPTIDADPTQMHQLLLNLIGNGLKFHQPGQAPLVTVRGEFLQEWRPEKVLSSEQLCQIIVQDNGIGFDEKYLNRIFGAFQRLHGRDAYPGTGIGLAICHKIVQRHEGTITAKSKPGKGAKFIVTLPTKQHGGEREDENAKQTDYHFVG